SRRERFARLLRGYAPDLLGVVLDPARTGVVLSELGVRTRANVALLVDDEAGRAGRSLVDCKQRLHAPSPSSAAAVPIRCRPRPNAYRHPSCSSRPSMLTIGRPITAKKSPSIRSTSVAPNPWMPYAPALSIGSPVATQSLAACTSSGRHPAGRPA